MNKMENLSDIDVVTCGYRKKGLKNIKTGDLILNDKKSKFNSLIPSRGNTPILPLVATYNNYSEYGEGFDRGAIYFDDRGVFHEVSLEVSPDGEPYDFIDGFDHGLARVYRIIDGKKNGG